VVAPTLPFGSSHHHVPFGGTLSLDTQLYYRVLSAIVESLIACGFRKCFILNGHGGNHELAQLVARDLALKHPVHLAAASYWNVAADALSASGATIHGRIPGHAGAFETSLRLALRPEIVPLSPPHRESEPATQPAGSPLGVRVELHGSWQHINGYTDSPDEGNAAYGSAALGAIVHAVAPALVAFSQAHPIPAP
jgi:creatinine amidohydrolase